MFSVTFVSVLGSTTVLPVLLNGLGCEAVSVLATVIVRLPWETAHCEMRMVDGGDDGAGALVDNERAGVSGVTSIGLEPRNEVHRPLLGPGRDADPDGGGIERLPRNW